jgi:gliding motility-associated-like protein
LSLIDAPNAFSPNGDGHNEYFIIKGIEDYPDNLFTIFDRWGIEVYSKRGYRNLWQGENNNGDPLPDGTYFYVLSIEGDNKAYKGFIDLRR